MTRRLPIGGRGYALFPVPDPPTPIPIPGSFDMPDTPELRDALFAIVQQMQPCTLREVVALLAQDHGIQMEPEQVRAVLEEMRTCYPRRTIHAGPDRWGALELG